MTRLTAKQEGSLLNWTKWFLKIFAVVFLTFNSMIIGLSATHTTSMYPTITTFCWHVHSTGIFTSAKRLLNKLPSESIAIFNVLPLKGMDICKRVLYFKEGKNISMEGNRLKIDNIPIKYFPIGPVMYMNRNKEERGMLYWEKIGNSKEDKGHYLLFTTNDLQQDPFFKDNSRGYMQNTFVSKDEFFFLGDNRYNSYDSRELGPTNIKSIRGEILVKVIGTNLWVENLKKFIDIGLIPVS